MLQLISQISRCPNELPKVDSDSIPKFHEHNDSTTLHISCFMVFISDLGVIHEDVVIRLFLSSLKGMQ
jgi:hypothetical protein